MQEETPREASRSFRSVITVISVALTLCLVCATLTFFAIPRRPPGIIPVTGDELVDTADDSDGTDPSPGATPTVAVFAPPSTPEPEGTAAPDTAQPAEPIPVNYRVQAEDQLTLCYTAFHAFVFVQQGVINNANLLKIDSLSAMPARRRRTSARPASL